MFYVKVPIMKDTERLRAYNHIDYRRNSQLLRSLFNDHCMFHDKNCGNIEIHHNDRNRHNNNLLNLVPVCKEAHHLIHLSNWEFNEMRLKLVQRLQFMIDCIKAGKTY